MKIECIDNFEFSRVFSNQRFIFNSVEFNLLHKPKCERLDFLLFHENDKKLGLIAGIKAGDLCSPFSAPFSCYFVQDDNIKTQYIFNATLLLEEYATSQNLNSIKLVLPPAFYNDNLISKVVFSLYRDNFSPFLMMNHSYLTSDFNDHSSGINGKESRKKVNHAQRRGLVFSKAAIEDEFRIAFDVILENKRVKNRPQHLTYEQLFEMTRLFKVDFFIVYHMGNPVAAAILYNHSSQVAHVIHWGDIPDSTQTYPMNFLSYNVFKYYTEMGVEIIDLGPSMVEGELHAGVAAFKESIGARSTLKYEFSKKLIN